MKDIITGQEFKNYRAVCKFLGEQFKTGNSKKSQIKEWGRYFSYKNEGNKFIITNVYDRPLEKATNHTSNNIKNIQPMIEYLQGKCDISNGCYHSMTAWYCECLGLLGRNICDVIYMGQIEIDEYCNKNNISNKRLLCEYVSAAKSSLKDMLLKSLKHMEKRQLVEYKDGYMFTYRLGKRSLGHFATKELNETIIANETDICNEMNRKHNLSDKFKGRQNLFCIYNREKLLKEFRHLTLSMLMNNENAITICNSVLDDYYGQGAGNISKYSPIISYYRGISIIGMEIIDADIEVLGTEICNIIRGKTRKQMFKKKYINKFTGVSIYPYDNSLSASDILTIEKILFKYVDDISLDFIQVNTDLDKELDELFDNKSVWGSDSIEKDYSMDEILDMSAIDEQYEFV